MMVGKILGTFCLSQRSSQEFMGEWINSPNECLSLHDRTRGIFIVAVIKVLNNRYVEFLKDLDF